ncbi:diamine N-acetyltransferase [Bacillus mesophilus]|uniref:GNAT family N-acetyltransferase n=1 Tax=Bacillus mesophilus TaxID=1808955 RepID=A0A6M0Q3R8_9BACI|nr:GNAT family N-acetyltransferase [Bacillus mesophilus]MBM7660324.1 diamine N-acetyltransferase [Bacillus mesophilus]NEY71035.1 GNAT family N-acetyltransferase [Bacillus mesophilus]
MVDLSYKPLIMGKKVTLRPFTEGDFPYIEECLKDPEVIKLTGSTPDFHRESIYKWYQTRNDQTERLDLAIVDPAQDILVGEVVANLYDESSQSMNFRILIGPRGRDRGLGTEATQLFIDYIFQNSNLDHLNLAVYDFNPRAKKVYEKIGFVTVSIDEKDLECEGDWIDFINMKLTRIDWFESKRE